MSSAYYRGACQAVKTEHRHFAAEADNHLERLG
jgi:hypothetical protein